MLKVTYHVSFTIEVDPIWYGQPDNIRDEIVRVETQAVTEEPMLIADLISGNTEDFSVRIEIED